MVDQAQESKQVKDQADPPVDTARIKAVL